MRSPPRALSLSLFMLACRSPEATDAPSTVKAAALPTAPRADEVVEAEPAPPLEVTVEELLRLNEAANQALRARDFATAAPLLGRACDANDLAACVRLADLLDRGAGVAEDAARARELYTRACAGGMQQACDQLGH